MVTFILGALTVVLVLNSLFLILLVLVQLPKKEAGIGMAFGGAATETLFGAGSGSVLTRATKYSAGLFMGLSLVLAMANSTVARKEGSRRESEIERLANSGGPAITAPAVPASNTVVAPAPAPASSTLLLTDTNAAAAPSEAAPAEGTEPAPADE
ncbi:MAG: preprotein translocase subunit SecG [Limisphaerales bacterium]